MMFIPFKHRAFYELRKDREGFSSSEKVIGSVREERLQPTPSGALAVKSVRQLRIKQEYYIRIRLVLVLSASKRVLEER